MNDYKREDEINEQDEEVHERPEAAQENYGNDAPQKENTKQSKSGVFAGVLGAVVVFVIAGVAYGAWSAGLIGFEASPREATMTGFEKVRDAEQYAFDGNVSVESMGTSTAQTSPQNFEFSMDGKVDTTSESARGTLDTELSFVGANGQSGTLGLETRLLDETVYVRFTKLIPILSFFGINNEEWLRIDLEESGSEVNATSTSVSKLSEEQQQRLKEIVRSHKDAFQVTEPYEEEQVQGVMARHFEVAFDRERLKDMLHELSRVSREYQKENLSSNEFTQVPEYSEEELEQRVDEFFDTVEDLSIEVWVGKDAGYVRKVAVGFDAQNPDNVSDVYRVEFDLSFTDFGESFEVSVPADVVSLEEYFGGGMEIGGSNPSGSFSPESMNQMEQMQQMNQNDIEAFRQ